MKTTSAIYLPKLSNLTGDSNNKRQQTSQTGPQLDVAQTAQVLKYNTSTDSHTHPDAHMYAPSVTNTHVLCYTRPQRGTHTFTSQRRCMQRAPATALSRSLAIALTPPTAEQQIQNGDTSLSLCSARSTALSATSRTVFIHKTAPDAGSLFEDKQNL